ncbi:MAG: hypothetical protein Q9180_009806, partial [Flavoplaca navasiana]
SDPYGHSRVESPESRKHEVPETDDGDDDESDQTPTDTREDTSGTIAAQEQKSTTFVAEEDGVLTPMTGVVVATRSSTPNSLSIPTSASSSSEETVTTESGAGMDSADMSLLGLLVAVGMGVLAY